MTYNNRIFETAVIYHSNTIQYYYNNTPASHLHNDKENLNFIKIGLHVFSNYDAMDA